MTSSAIIKQAVAEVAIRVKQGEIISDLEAITSVYPDGIEAYVEAALEAAIRKDTASMNRNIRDAQMNQAQHVQLALPGIADPALPALIRVKDTDGQWSTVPFDRAEGHEIEQEIMAMERKAANISATIAAYRQTWDALKSTIPYSEDMTGGDCRAMLRALASGE